MVLKIDSLLARRDHGDEEGQALVEYALILMLVAMVSVAILGAIGQSVLGPLTSVGNAI
jgi:Flp pilus assembly pilin Flp